MIALFFAWTIILVVFYSFGNAFLKLCQLIAKDKTEYPLISTLLIGMCITTSVIAIFSLLMPANTMLLFALVFMCMIYWYANNKAIVPLINNVIRFIEKQPRLHLALYAIVIISVAMFCTLHPMMTDTLYYHYQNLMWNEQYAIVPGLGNLQPRFAFNSSFFLLGSTFGLKPLFGQYIFGVHTFFLALIFVWLIYKVIHTKEIIRSIVALVMFLSLFVFYKTHITSVTTDFIPNLLVCYLVLAVIFDRDIVNKRPILYFLLPIFIITLKISCFSIILLPLYVLWKQLKDKKYKKTTLIALGALLIVVPWCVRTVILSGYLIFPFPAIDLFDFDWKVPVAYAMEQKEFIQSFARYPNNIDIQSVLAMPMSEWLPIWWKSDMFYFNPIANKLFCILTIITLPLGVFYFFKHRKDEEYKAIRLIWSASAIGILVWFFNAPDFRFIFGLILAQVFLTILQLLEKRDFSLIQNRFTRIQIVLALFTVIFVASYSTRWVYYQRDKSVPFTNFLKVPSSIEYTRKTKGVPSKDSFITVEVNDLTIHRKSLSDRDVLCFDFDLPASADYVGGIEMRGENLQDGFRCNPEAEHRLTY